MIYSQIVTDIPGLPLSFIAELISRFECYKVLWQCYGGVTSRYKVLQSGIMVLQGVIAI